MRLLSQYVFSLAAAFTVLAAPEVKLGRTTVIGRDIPSLQQEFFGGLPYAEPPLGTLRWKPPVFKEWIDADTFNATEYALPCLQYSLSEDQSSEDCLTLNVLRPSGVSSRDRLPIFFWNPGAGFFGADGRANASGIVAQSVQRGTPIIYVSFNYRVGAFGFPQGQEIVDARAQNLGLKDELAALAWIQKHIGKFGGDKDKVTVGGGSAGGIINSILFLDPDFKKYARAGIFESGTASTSLVRPAQARQGLWDLFVSGVPSCAKKAGTLHTLDCLRSVNTTELVQGTIKAMENWNEFIPWNPTIDGPGGVYPFYPSALLPFGHFAKLPFLTGTCLDEGTVFTTPLVNYTEDVLRQIFKSNYSATRAKPETFQRVMNHMLKLYPDDPALGSPFGTGNETFGLSPGYKRAAALNGDASFLSQRRYWQERAAQWGVKSYGYHWTTARANASLAPYLGVSHESEYSYLFGGAVDHETPGAADLQPLIIDYWVSFITSLNPSDGKGIERTTWTPYSSRNLAVLQFHAENTTMVPDNFRQKQTDFINANPLVFGH
ncbi:hypothetical protein D9758_007278 [Tetrapyrgos nigripes]|uniref:Carboxylic ester hydrolase n=1 Tax=Tetrapyrgos nigripes TaxID=182062 RepID=A0A8H5GB26_9AGAR|nr:hypothetical protein D9758_007278 [Tetrapyrgos nigripes]